MKNAAFYKAIDEALENALADLARESVFTDTPAFKAVAPAERGKTNDVGTKTSRNDSEAERAHSADFVVTESGRAPLRLSGIIDHKVTLLALAGAAVKADAEPCLDRIVHELEGTGVTKADIREAVESGRFLGVRPDLAARVFKGNCAALDEPESVQPSRSRAEMSSAAKRN